ncbi:hypothetical protein [Sphingosinithalassobacter sp. CS137]|uniref:hypothetical protein n=1 Tax=Sphingosinithalassobacter sp. CS137 TaxID=2762748 RepID=UPI00165D3D35|nr:hypothetical protein [Sphingosinithalassobacter sp. CS137]
MRPAPEGSPEHPSHADAFAAPIEHRSGIDSAYPAHELTALSSKARAIAGALDGIVARQAPVAGCPPTRANPRIAGSAALAMVAKQYLRHRRMRDALFPTGLFADPAWDLLLDLYVAGVERRRISISSACIAAAVPSTTALRWIAVLESKGLILRIADSKDRRRAYLTLGAQASRSIEAWLQDMSGIGSTGAD